MGRFQRALKGGLVALAIAGAPVKASGKPEIATTSYYERVERPDLENIAAYDHRGNLYDITALQTPVSAAPHPEQLEYLMRTSPSLTLTHNHPVNPDALVDMALANGRKDIAYALERQKKSDPERLKRRLLYERPSDADVRFLALTKLKNMLYHDEGRVRQQIAVLEDGKPQRLVEYDLAPGAEAALRTSARAFRSAADAYKRSPSKVSKQRMVRAGKDCALAVDGIVNKYSRSLYEYDSRHAKPWEERGPEPSMDGFYRKVNSENAVRLTDRGFHGKPIYFPQRSAYALPRAA